MVLQADLMELSSAPPNRTCACLLVGEVSIMVEMLVVVVVKDCIRLNSVASGDGWLLDCLLFL